METDLQNIVRVVEGADAGLISRAIKITDGAPTDSIAGFTYLAEIYNSFNGKTYLNTGSKTSTTWESARTPGTITQETTISTGVTVQALAGVITTVASTLAADAVAEFAVTNGKVKSTSVVLLTVQYATGKTGTPIATIKSVSDGSFAITLRNGHASAALNDVVKIHYSII